MIITLVSTIAVTVVTGEYGSNNEYNVNPMSCTERITVHDIGFTLYSFLLLYSPLDLDHMCPI